MKTSSHMEVIYPVCSVAECSATLTRNPLSLVYLTIMLNISTVVLSVLSLIYFMK